MRENWNRFVHAVGLQHRALVRARQVHGCEVLQADRQDGVVRPEPPFMDGDALLTGDAGHALSVRVADCAPVLLADPQARLGAAIHAGWRGVVGGIVPRAIDALVARGAHPSRLLAAVGACIGGGSFQVGPEVGEAFGKAGLRHCVQPDEQPGRLKADIRTAIRTQLEGRMIEADRIDIDAVCTMIDHESLFSYRRDGARSGRMACIIGL